MIPVGLYDHPTVRAIIDEAYRRIGNWEVTHHETTREAKELLTSGWTGVALMELVACPLLELEGITEKDLADFEQLELNVPGSINRRTLYELWDQRRAQRAGA